MCRLFTACFWTSDAFDFLKMTQRTWLSFSWRLARRFLRLLFELDVTTMLSVLSKMLASIHRICFLVGFFASLDIHLLIVLVSFEILGMLSRTFHIKNSMFTHIPNPTSDRWDKQSVSLVKVMEAYEDLVPTSLPGARRNP